MKITRRPDEDWERIERDEKYPVEITQRTEPKQEREQDAECIRPKTEQVLDQERCGTGRACNN